MDESAHLHERLARRFLADYPLEAARLLESLSSTERIRLFHHLDPPEAAEVLRLMNPASASDCLPLWPQKELPELLTSLGTGSSATLLRRLASPVREELLSVLPPRTSRPIRRVLNYPPETAGAFMDPSPHTVTGDVTVSEALEQIRRNRSSVDEYVYTTDRHGVLRGVLSLRDLLGAPGEAELSPLEQRPVDRVSAQSELSSLLKHPGWENFHALPVVDRDNHLLGVLEFKTLLGRRDHDARRDPPFLVSVGEMYWTLLSRIVDVTPAPGFSPISRDREEP